MTIHIGSKALLIVGALVTLALVAVVAGVIPVSQMFWLGLVVICPLMMFFMMRGMHNAERHLLPDPGQVGRVATPDGDMNFLDLAHELGLPGLLGAEKEPGEKPTERYAAGDDQ
jgi:hypothetical protein